MSSLRVIMSGGGTGGHIFPAIAIANAIKEKEPDAEFLFVGAKGKMEMEKVPAAGFNIEGLWISGFQRSLSLKNLSFPFKLMASMVRAHNIIREFKPDIVIGTGGFASGPILRAAASQRVPTVIQEQNSFPGITNKILGIRASKVCVAYDGMEQFFPKDKILVSGNPVRKEVIQIDGKRNDAISFFNLDTSKKTILVIGGSLGARSINLALKDQLQKIVDAGVQLVWQTGKTSFEEAKQAASGMEDNIKVHEFISSMDLAYAAADVVISRAGAIAISELCLVKKPVILVPLPHAAEDHQTKNAQALVDKDAGVLIKDSEAKDILVNQVLSLLKDENKLKSLTDNIGQMALNDAAGVIAEEVINIVKR